MTDVLAFDTSGPWVAAALVSDGVLVASRSLPMEKGQAEALMPLVEELLRDAGRAGYAGLTLLACGTGPGNFTGTRIAVAAARALALALNLPAVGVSLLEAAAEGQALPCLVALDARRGESYAQRFGDGATAPALLPAGAELPLAGCASLIGSAEALAGLPEARPLPAPEDLVTSMARIAARRAAAGENLPRPAPLYLRAADAAPPREPPPVILA